MTGKYSDRLSMTLRKPFKKNKEKKTFPFQDFLNFDCGNTATSLMDFFPNFATLANL